MVEEVGELELGDELLEEKLQEFGGCEECGDSKMNPIHSEGCPSFPYIESGTRACIKKKVLPTEGL
jgi:hypothetical protein